MHLSVIFVFMQSFIQSAPLAFTSDTIVCMIVCGELKNLSCMFKLALFPGRLPLHF